MKRCVATVAAVALCAGLFSGHALAAAKGAVVKTVVWNPFTGEATTRPPNFTLAQDGSVGLSKLKWVGWGSDTATGIGVDSYRLWPAFKFATASGTIQLTRKTLCGGKIYYSHAVATIKSVKYGATKPRTSAGTFSLLPSKCAPNLG